MSSGIASRCWPERRDRAAQALFGGQQQVLALARALLCRPRVLTLDEPSTGLSPAMWATVIEALEVATGAGTAVLLGEQRLLAVRHLADHYVVLERGRVQVAGAASTLDGLDIDARYFGTGAAS